EAETAARIAGKAAEPQRRRSARRHPRRCRGVCLSLPPEPADGTGPGIDLVARAELGVARPAHRPTQRSAKAVRRHHGGADAQARPGDVLLPGGSEKEALLLRPRPAAGAVHARTPAAIGDRPRPAAGA